MTNNIELLSQYDNFTIGANSNLTEILANVVKVGTDTSNVTISIPQDISSSYNLILPVRQGASGESLVYGADGQLKWDDPTILKQVITVFGSKLSSSKVDSGEMHSVHFPPNYEARIIPLSANTKIFVQFKVNYNAALSLDNQIDFYIYKYINGSQTHAKIFSERIYGPNNAAGGFVGQYISNLIDESNTTDEIKYQLGYKINGTVDVSDTLGILGYDNSHNNTIVLQEFEGSGVYATSVWNKGADSNGLYYNDGTVHIGSAKNALGSQNTEGVALELSGNLVGTNANFSGNVNAVTMTATTTTTTHLNLNGNLVTSSSSYVEGNLIPSANITYDLGSSTHMWRDVYVGPGSLYVNNKKVIEDNNNTINITTDVDQNLTIKTSGVGILQLNSNVGGIDFNTSNGGTINFNSDIVLQGSISMTNTGSTIPINLNDDVNVTGNLDVTSNLKVNDISRKNQNYGVNIVSVSIDGSEITGQLIGNVTGDVTGTVSSLSNHTTDNLTQGSTNKYFSTTLIDSHLSGGTGVTYSNGSISIGQSVGISDDVQFNNVTVNGTLHSDDITGSNVTVSNDLVVSGNLRVNGTQTIVNSTTLDIGDHKIVVNADGGSTTDAGIIANVAGVEHEFVYTSNHNAWGTTGDLNIGGNITSTSGYFIGDGSQLTGLTDTDTTYSAGTGMFLDGTTFSIGQSVNVSDNPSFTQMYLGNIGVNQGILNLQDITNNGTEDVAQIKGIKEGTNGGQLQFYTKADSGGSLTEKLRINNQGAFGIGGSNYGSPGQVLTSDGSGNPVSWVNPSGPDFLLFDIGNQQTLIANQWAQVKITYAFGGQPTSNNSKNITIDANGVITFANPGVYVLNAKFHGHWGYGTDIHSQLGPGASTTPSSSENIAFTQKNTSSGIIRDALVFSGIPILIPNQNYPSTGNTWKFWVSTQGGSNGFLGSSTTPGLVCGSIIRIA